MAAENLQEAVEQLLDTLKDLPARKVTLVLDNVLFGERQSFASVQELDAEIARRAHEWWSALQTELTEEEYVTQCQIVARRIAVPVSETRAE